MGWDPGSRPNGGSALRSPSEGYLSVGTPEATALLLLGEVRYRQLSETLLSVELPLPRAHHF